MANKFLNLIEATIERMTNGGILTGDRVQLVDGYKSHEGFQNYPKQSRTILKRCSRIQTLIKR